jgi:two-component system CheB/CheR fusion protein
MPSLKNRKPKKTKVGIKRQQPVTQSDHDFPVVGIGASAGGLEAFTTFLQNLPNDTGMAFVIVSHQDPSHESNLTELLKKVSSMPTVLVQDKLPIQPNHVYVIPPNTDLTIVAGMLRLAPRQAARGAHLPIDNFFQSLAAFSKNKAIGVVLSGTASDGTLGLTAIKAENGITFAQNEASAKYGGMPRHAIDSNVVDFVLPPDQIAKEIARIATDPLGRKKIPEFDIPSEATPALNQIFNLLRKSTGVDFSHYKPNTVIRRINRRMLLHRMKSLESYTTFLKDNAKEIDALYEDILINVTSFFRDPAVFDTLKNTIFPKILKSSRLTSEQAIRIWVPGCSSGEEAFSIAIALQEYLGEERPPKGISIQIFATDISETAIERARAGIYPNSISADVSAQRLRRFFSKTDHGFQIQKSIRDLCIFARHNVAKDPPFSKIDLISCRNLLIYLGLVLQRKIMPIFHYALNPNGYLLLGSTESIGGFAELFFPADKMYKLYSKKTVPTRLHFEHLEPFSTPKFTAPGVPNIRVEVIGEKDVLREGDRLTLSRYAPASVIVNENFDILQFRGRTGVFFEPSSGQASLNIMKMAREGIVGQLRECLLLAKKEKTSVTKKDLPILLDGAEKTYNLEVAPFAMPRSSQLFYLIFFELIDPEASKRSKKAKITKSKAARAQANKEMIRLREELGATKDYLQSIIEEYEATNEELRAANEEILSSNEELQSTNEEMETAKEELQSANEELTTVNEELQVRNMELSYVNNDLTNFLSSVQIPIVMLGRDLRIRRFTPIAERIFNLIPSDVGRPITDINLSISISDLSAKILEVTESVNIKELEIQDKAGRWYNLQIRPYKTIENVIDGAVLVLIDIDSLKKTVDIKSGRTYLQSLIGVLQEPFLALDELFRIKMLNEAFINQFKIDRTKFDGDSFFQIADGKWNIPALKSLLQTMVSDGTNSATTTIHYPSADVGSTKIKINIFRMREQDGQYLLLLSMTES